VADHGFIAHDRRLGNLLVMAQAGFLSHADTVDSLPDGGGDRAAAQGVQTAEAAQNAAT
jgi:hypothetical protein